MKTLKSDIFYAMNEINDKYILEAAQCLEQKKKTIFPYKRIVNYFMKVTHIAVNGWLALQLQWR
jgi:hypothetical protein